MLQYVSVLTLLALYISAKHIMNRAKNLPPSPYPFLPILSLLYLIKKPIYRSLSRCAEGYGPIVLFQVGYRRLLVVSSPSLLEECLTKNDVVFANRPRLLFGKYIGCNYTSLVWAPYGDHFRNLRRISSLHLLSTQRLQMLTKKRVDEVKSLITFLLSQKEDQVVDMRTAFFELTHNGMMRMIAGDVADSEEVKRFREIQLETFRLFGTVNLGDFLPFFNVFGPGRLEKKLIELQRKREEFVQSLIERDREKLGTDRSSATEGKEKTMIEVLLELQETEPEYYKDETINGLLLVLLFATDSSVHTMEWALSVLLNHPQVLKLAQTEIDNVVGQDRLINESDIGQLPYLRGIVNETLRMYPPGPLLLPHESSQHCTVGGFHIPRDTTLLLNIWAIHNDSKFWVDPRKFKPERFEGFEGARDRFKFVPFGLGRRGCPGEVLAMYVVGLALGSLIQCFEWERVSEEMVDMRERGGFTLARVIPLHAKCRPRASMVKVLSQI